MSKKELRLRDVCDIVRGERITKKQLSENGFPVVSGGSGYMGYYPHFNREGKNITIAQYGTAGLVRWHENEFWANDVCMTVINNDLINQRYLYYFLISKQEYIFSIVNKDAIPHSVNKEQILNIKISLPDLTEQERIVNILDKFSNYEKELEKELEQRNKQYNYYLDKLLSYKDSSCTKYKLKDVCDFQRGKVISKAKSTPGNFPVIGGGKKPAYFVDTYNRDGEIITVAGSGAYAGYVQYFNKPIFLADAFSITTNECNVKYIYYFLKNNQDKIHDFKKGSGVPHVYISDLEKLDINLPPIEIQKEIVCVLDKFNNIINDIQIGLPKEKELRKKQYEYYLEKLIQN